MKTSHLLMCLMFFLSLSVYSASYSSDNILRKITFFKSSKQKIIELDNLSKDYLDNGEYKKARECAGQGLKLALKTNSYENISEFYNLFGRICYYQNQWDSGLFYFNKSLAVARKINNKEYMAKAYNNIALFKYNQNKGNEALENCDLALKIYTDIGNKKGIASSYNCYGHIYIRLSEIKPAIDYLLKSVKILDESEDYALQYNNYIYLAEAYINYGKIDSSFYFLNKVLENANRKFEKTDLAFAYSLMGYVYYFYDNHSKALEYHFKALAIYEKINYKKGFAIVYSFIGDIFEKRDDYKNAIKYFKKCLEVSKEIGQNYGIILSYNHLGYNYFKLKEFEIAKRYFSDVLLQAENLHFTTEYVDAIHKSGLIFLEQKDYDKALGYFQRGMKVCKDSDIRLSLPYSYYLMGRYYNARSDYKKAIYYYNCALKYDKELNDMYYTARDLECISENYALLSQYKPAYEYFKQYATINDSLESGSHTKRITQLEMEYEFDKKQKEQEFIQQRKEQVLKAKIKNQKIITFSVVTSISLLSVISLLAFRNYRLKQKNMQKDIELQHVESTKKHEMDQMKLHFFANISHDIRTPLTLISGPLEEIINSGDASPKLHKTLELVKRNAGLLNRLVDQVLDFQKIDSKRINLVLFQNDIIQFIKNITEAFAYFIETKNCKLEFKPETEELLMWFDPEKFEKIMYNLIFNAIKFTPEYGTIKIKIRTDAEKVYITIKDSGIGIPLEHLEFIFERYFQVEKAKAFYKGGSGIGLAHAKELIQLHKGEITVDSKENQGTEFTLILPQNKDAYLGDERTVFQENGDQFLHTVSSENTTASESATTSEIRLRNITNQENKPTVLIVEDNIDMHQYLINCLQDDYVLFRAYNGDEGFSLAMQNNPDLIISDIMMENTDGLELCNKIKTELQVCHIPVILLTALASLENKITGFETGADDYITKPFNTKLLLTRVKNLIESRRLLREIFNKNVLVQPENITNNSIDEAFIRKAVAIVEANMSESNFNVDNLCFEMGVSRSVFFRKIKAITNQASNDFIKSIRLKHAAHLLTSTDQSVTQIAIEVGFADQKYFSTCFRKYFGKSPSEYVKKASIN